MDRAVAGVDETSEREVEKIMGSELVDIVIVGFRPGLETERLLEDIPATTWSPFRVYYFDNTGNPKSLSEAWNDLAFAGSAPYIAVLNSDVIPSPGWDVRMMQALGHEDIGAVMPHAIGCPNVVYLGKSITTSVPPTREDMERAASIAVDESNGKPIMMDFGGEHGPFYAVMLRRADFASLKGFDERLRFYAQDHDFQDRLRSRGMKNVRLENCPFFHGDSVSTKKAIEEGDIDIMEEYRTIGRHYGPIKAGAVPRWDALSDEERASIRRDPAYRMSSTRRSR